MTPNPTWPDTVEALRGWAAGSYPLTAAVELLARAFDARFTRPGLPWIAGTPGGPDPSTGSRAAGGWRLDADVLAAAAQDGPYSGGQRRLLAIAASLAGAGPVDLCQTVPGLDRGLLDLVLAALAHAGGSHDHPVMAPHPGLDGALFPTRRRAGSLHPWPGTSNQPGRPVDHGDADGQPRGCSPFACHRAAPHDDQTDADDQDDAGDQGDVDEQGATDGVAELAETAGARP